MPFCYYVGITPEEEARKRLTAHFAQTADCLYTATRKPLEIELLWPAPNRATEAYVFFAMVEKLPLDAVTSGRLGGWA